MQMRCHPFFQFPSYSGFSATRNGPLQPGWNSSLFCSQGVAPSTRSTYQSALWKFAEFCSLYSIVSPFPVSESILCYFSSYLACKTLSPQTIKTYLAGIRHMQITLGLPEPRAFSSLPRLRLVQSGIQKTHA